MDTNAIIAILSALTNHATVVSAPGPSIPLNWNIIIPAFFSAVTAFFVWKTNQKLEKVVEKVEAVEVTTNKTEKLVNSQSGIQKRNYEISTALNAKLEASPENIKLAENAATAVKEHDANQAQADKVQEKADVKAKV